MDLRTMMNEQNDTKQTNFIPNPLPVPKRHSPREMSYDYEVTPDKMHYDIETHPADDFDI
ncbi:MAG: hypothetical protein ACI4AA_10405 [Lachnospiraceae bacterium]